MADRQDTSGSHALEDIERRPYSPPKIEHLGAMSEVTAFDPEASGSDGPYGASS